MAEPPNPRQRARARGLAPDPAAFRAWLRTAGGLLGLLVTLYSPPWADLLADLLRHPRPAPLVLALLWLLLGPSLGATCGHLLAYLLSQAPPSFGLRLRAAHGPRPRSLGLFALGSVALAALCVPALLPAQGDAGALWVRAGAASLLLGLLATLPAALIDRARALRLHRRHTRPPHHPAARDARQQLRRRPD